MTKISAISLMLAAAAAVVPGTMAFAAGAPAQAGAAATPVAPDPVAVAALVDKLSAALEALPVNATVQDAKAKITFVIDQAQQPGNVVKAALEIVRRKKWSTVIFKALRDASVGTGGTGGIGGTGGASGASGLGSGPTVGGGGGTDYSNNK